MSKQCILLSERKIRAQKMGKLLSSHRSTAYPCSVPDLGDSAGAGRERLTHCKSNNNFYFTIKFTKFVSHEMRSLRGNQAQNPVCRSFRCIIHGYTSMP